MSPWISSENWPTVVLVMVVGLGACGGANRAHVAHDRCCTARVRVLGVFP